jgi:hypothetical protein
MNKIYSILLKYGEISSHEALGGRFYYASSEISKEDHEELFNLGMSYNFDTETFYLSDEDASNG